MVEGSEAVRQSKEYIGCEQFETFLAATLAGRFVNSMRPRVWTQCVPGTRELLQQLLCTAVQQFFFFRVLVRTFSEGARPTPGLIIVSRVRRRDIYRSTREKALL